MRRDPGRPPRYRALAGRQRERDRAQRLRNRRPAIQSTEEAIARPALLHLPEQLRERRDGSRSRLQASLPQGLRGPVAEAESQVPAVQDECGGGERLRMSWLGRVGETSGG